MQVNFSGNRRDAIDRLPEFDALRDRARDIKDRTLAHLDSYLEAWETAATAAGVQVHWARDGAEARETIAGLCRDAGVRVIAKAKSMIGEEIGLNPHLEAAGFETVETDLGEYIVQLADEPPSHIIGPAVHKTVDQVADLFHEHHAARGQSRKTEGAALVGEAREMLRDVYFRADAAITGANMLVAETGSIVIVTNEGNADLAQGLARTHIVLASIEKVVPSLDDAATILRVPRAFGHRPGHGGLHDPRHRAAARGRERRPRTAPRRVARQRAQRPARHALPRGSALHPLRRLHEPLPRLRRRRRPCLRVGLSRPPSAPCSRRPSWGWRRGGICPTLRVSAVVAPKCAPCASPCRT